MVGRVVGLVWDRICPEAWKTCTDIVMGELLRRGVLAPERQHGGASELGTWLHLEETMEQQDEESLESPQACVENFVLPQEMIIEVEGEDAGSLDVVPQESTDFKIVTVDLTEEEQSTWHNPQRTPERSVILEGHRDLWDLPAVHGIEETTSKQTVFDEETSHGVKTEGLAREDPWLSSCEEVCASKEQLEKKQEKQEEAAFTQGRAGTPGMVCRSDEFGRISFPLMPVRNHFHKQAAHVKSYMAALLQTVFRRFVMVQISPKRKIVQMSLRAFISLSLQEPQKEIKPMN